MVGCVESIGFVKVERSTEAIGFVDTVGRIGVTDITVEVPMQELVAPLW